MNGFYQWYNLPTSSVLSARSCNKENSIQDPFFLVKSFLTSPLITAKTIFAHLPSLGFNSKTNCIWLKNKKAMLIYFPHHHQRLFLLVTREDNCLWFHVTGHKDRYILIDIEGRKRSETELISAATHPVSVNYLQTVWAANWTSL